MTLPSRKRMNKEDLYYSSKKPNTPCSNKKDSWRTGGVKLILSINIQYNHRIEKRTMAGNPNAPPREQKVEHSNSKLHPSIYYSIF